jgi:hypothetical protein
MSAGAATAPTSINDTSVVSAETAHRPSRSAISQETLRPSIIIRPGLHLRGAAVCFQSVEFASAGRPSSAADTCSVNPGPSARSPSRLAFRRTHRRPGPGPVLPRGANPHMGHRRSGRLGRHPRPRPRPRPSPPTRPCRAPASRSWHVRARTTGTARSRRAAAAPGLPRPPPHLTARSKPPG